MPTTNYYSVNGKIVGQKVAGQPASARVDYVTDALGSVLATADQTGAVQNRYAYKPYGAQFAKTGTAPDPAFTWVGSYGYRQTGRKYSDLYVRARHYVASKGRWTTTDPVGYGEGINLYSYVSAMSTTHYDSSGLQQTGKPDKRTGCCGPDISGPMYEAMDRIQYKFNSWKNGKKHNQCYQLLDVTRGSARTTWDVVQVHEWANGTSKYYSYYRDCATKDCANTMEINDTCWYAGSINYATFGVMMRKCYQWLSTEGKSVERQKFSAYAMTQYIIDYKFFSPNVQESIAWALAAWQTLMPTVPTSIKPDRGFCNINCSEWKEGYFTVNWSPSVLLPPH